MHGSYTPVRVIQNTGQRIVPRQKRSQQRKEAPSLLNRRIDLACGIRMQIGDSEEQEGHVQREEQGEEGDCRAESG